MRRRLTLIPLALLGLLALAAPARAIPDGGAGANTPGTNSSVAPRSLTAGSTIRFTVSGYPAGEVVYIKIDDGTFCSNKGVHGACVVHQQRLSSSGTAAGSFVLPSDLRPGRHWLRFLASKEMTDASGSYLGTKGWTTRRGADFTVVAGGPAAGSVAGSATTGTGEAGASTVLPAGETLVIAAPPAPTAGTPSTGTPGATDAGSAPGADPTSPGADLSNDPQAEPGEPGDATSIAPDDKASIEAAVEAALAESPDGAGTTLPTRSDTRTAGFPWTGSVGLAVLLVASLALVLRARRGRAGRA